MPDYYVYKDSDDGNNKIKAKNSRTETISKTHSTNADIAINDSPTNHKSGGGAIHLGPGTFDTYLQIQISIRDLFKLT